MITIKHANRTFQDQLKRGADIINGLRNKVTMFRSGKEKRGRALRALVGQDGPEGILRQLYVRNGSHPALPVLLLGE
ncbi:hypothetical protein PsorP6_000507 [Peronosclerospora sorghi]|uniref:Uncharacterized protein n=1 Tax=Peronosclerospora sorghi TaxID=230839 RepID=A0ACC0WVC8_9STRA|nr:hypothetical protein PsorP6_000507 [Peronosclerospora sorghi]